MSSKIVEIGFKPHHEFCEFLINNASNINLMMKL